MNSIWELMDENGNLAKGQDQLKNLAQKHFGRIFKIDDQSSLEAQLKTIILFPTFFDDEDKDYVGKQVNLKEVDEALKLFKKEKIPGPDGWTVDLFLHFFYIMGQ